MRTPLSYLCPIILLTACSVPCWAENICGRVPNKALAKGQSVSILRTQDSCPKGTSLLLVTENFPGSPGEKGEDGAAGKDGEPGDKGIDGRSRSTRLVFSGTSQAVVTGTPGVRFFALNGLTESGGYTNESVARIAVPLRCEESTLVVQLPQSLIEDDTLEFAVHLNGASFPLSCTINAGTGAKCTSATPQTIAAGSTISLAVTSTGSIGTIGAAWSLSCSMFDQ
jgi:hypothetical protein